ncbi:MAG TPA: chromosome segregation protein SMC [Gammaproteobacteria bacterium]|jgi:chromosome segregation protein|nr:chromosome segregation protein SMC [Gammaproteobacteria bacterium]
MRLSKIKLVGFKSFVDPTLIHFPSNLVGIVGPNGCGKSNIIDAVRWVLGETSAKYLRGDSMADVIFNGSTARKPVSSASIELTFDNSDGAIGGQYANYGEVSVRREVVRDGTSNYFLNGVRCRRRDITDLFLGTGLGPRSYAIIEQGTISRLVESKPEDLRMFLEEAAGISKYKERRRETENRIHHTKENVERLNDLRDEVEKQLLHLQRQARAAERYKELAEEKRKYKAELLGLNWRGLDADVGAKDGVISERETSLEAAVAEQRSIEHDMEKARVRHDEATDGFNVVQGRFYELGATIARAEQALQHARELRKRQQGDLEQSETQWRELDGHITRDRGQLETLDTELKGLEPAHADAKQVEGKAHAAFAQAEQSMQDWQAAWETFNREASEHGKAADVGRAQVEQLERQLMQLLQRRERVEAERKQYAADSQQQAMANLDSEAQAAEAKLQRLQTELAEVLRNLETERGAEQQASRALHELRSQLEDRRGRVASLEALQQAALGKSREQVAAWLKQKRLDSAPRLAEKLHVDSGWERAVETVLGWHLEAVCVSELSPRTEELAGLAGGSMTFVEEGSLTGGNAGSLLQKVKGPAVLADFLAGVRTAESLGEALQLRAKLTDGESIITRDGMWLGRQWLRVIRDNDERAGVLAREQELRALKQTLADNEKAATEQTGQLESRRSAVKDLETSRELLQMDANRANREAADAQAKFKAARSSQEQVAQRIKALETEAAELTAQVSQTEQEIKGARGRVEAALNALQKLDAQRATLQAERDGLRTKLDGERQAADRARAATHEVALKLESRRSLKTSTAQNMARMQAQIAQLDKRRVELNKSIEEAMRPMHDQEQELKTLLDKRTRVDAELTEARRAVESVAEHLRQLDQARVVRERKAEALREEVQQLRLDSQEVRVRRETIVEQLKSGGLDLQQVLQSMPEGAEVGAWAEKLAETEQRIARLGDINMAAINEYAEQSERKKYLDAQLADLTEALNILENAIKKIDRETRTRFKETFDKVNSGLSANFPKLFGGGHAYLELTGEELLDAGVAIMARPPGKRNSSIHLLSGGEKALTAVAMVFSIFELNPAPFCMLDEVDAPLDEANIGRFCDMVRSMSDRVQFIFISHNKGTMEMSNQLMGVTMNEPGVSRLVAVDVEEAVRIAAM